MSCIGKICLGQMCVIIYNFNNSSIELKTANVLVSFISEIGVGLAGMGIAFIFLGILLLFDKGLLAIGNVILSYLIYNS